MNVEVLTHIFYKTLTKKAQLKLNRKQNAQISIEKQQFESSNKGVEIRQKGFLQPTYIRRTSDIVIGPDLYNVF